MSPISPRLRGVGVGRGGAVGPIAQVRSAPQVPADASVLIDGMPAGRWAVHRRVAEAFFIVADRLHQQASQTAGSASSVIEAVAQLADDRALQSEILSRIAAGEPPIAAIDAVVTGFATMFEQTPNESETRGADLFAVRDFVVAQVMGLPAPGVPPLDEPSIIVARELSPADIAALDLKNVLAIVTELGGPTSHSAIVAGQLELPCIVQVAGITALPDGVIIAVDAVNGTVTLDPGQESSEEFARRRNLGAVLSLDRAPGATSDDVAVALQANIASEADAIRLASSAVEGVGLFRSESLFQERVVAPSLAEQTSVYASVLRAMGGRQVVIRTLDAGADKPLAFVHHTDEDNPALGVRGYRLTRTHPELLSTQLRAIAQAQFETGIEPWVMAPMISTATEARSFAAEAHGYGLKQVGVMIEVPAAALRAENILAEVDFVSLGTNDLAQYTMAGDRLLGELSDLLNPWQPAMLDLVAMTAQAGAKLGKPVGVCGEAAGDPVLAMVFVGLGVGSLSMVAAATPMVRHALRHHTIERTRQMARVARAASSAEAARAAALELVAPQIRDELEI